MTITRRQLIGAAATVAAGVMPAVKAVEVASEEYGVDAMEVLNRLWPEPWMPTTFYMRGDRVRARGKTYIATRNRVSPPFFTETGWQRESV